MDEVKIEYAAPYAAADAACTFALVEKLDPKLDRDPNAPEVDPLWGTPNPPAPRDVFERIEMPLVPVIVSMEQAGVLLDMQALKQMSLEMGEMIAQLEEQIYDLTGGYGKFNLNSPKQLNDVLFGKLGLSAHGVRKTTHGFSTAADVLDNMRGDHPIIAKILDYRELAKLKGTYVDALPALINRAPGAYIPTIIRRGQHGTLEQQQSEPAKHPDPHRNRARGAPCVYRAAGDGAAGGRLQPG